MENASTNSEETHQVSDITYPLAYCPVPPKSTPVWLQGKDPALPRVTCVYELEAEARLHKEDRFRGRSWLGWLELLVAYSPE